MSGSEDEEGQVVWKSGEEPRNVFEEWVLVDDVSETAGLMGVLAGVKTSEQVCASVRGERDREAGQG